MTQEDIESLLANIKFYSNQIEELSNALSKLADNQTATSSLINDLIKAVEIRAIQRYLLDQDPDYTAQADTFPF